MVWFWIGLVVLPTACALADIPSWYGKNRTHAHTRLSISNFCHETSCNYTSCTWTPPVLGRSPGSNIAHKQASDWDHTIKLRMFLVTLIPPNIWSSHVRKTGSFTAGVSEVLLFLQFLPVSHFFHTQKQVLHELLFISITNYPTLHAWQCIQRQETN